MAETTSFQPPHDGNRKARGAARPAIKKSVTDAPLLCTLGWHRAGLMARWNAGTGFSVCERCGCDLVRTLFEKWHVPRGCKVVWATAADRRRADTSGSQAAPAPADMGKVEFPGLETHPAERGDAMADPGTGDEIGVQDPDRDVFGDEDDAGFVAIADDLVESLEGTSSQQLASKRPRTAIPDFMDDPEEDDASAWPLSRNIARACFEDGVDLSAAGTPLPGEWTGRFRRTGN